MVGVRSFSELEAAVSAPGKHIVLSGSGVWDGGGIALSIPANTTVDGEGSGVVLKNVWLRVTSSNVILRYLRVRTGDEVSADADAINLNGAAGCIHGIVVDHVEAIWAPDVGGLAILNCVRDVTVQHSIIGVGLTRSSHPESGDDADGHNMGFNIAGQVGDAVPERITVWRNLITTAINRNPQVQGARSVDLVNNVIYNYVQPPQGNPQGLNVVNNLYRRGPAPESAGLAHDPRTWYFRGSSDHPSAYPGSVYLSGNAADGFSAAAPEAPSSALRDSPYGSVSVVPESTEGLLDRVLAEAGPAPRDALTTRWLTEAANRSGVYFNGAGMPPPNPRW